MAGIGISTRGTRSTAARPQTPRTTPGMLRWRRAWLLGGTAVALVAAFCGFEATHLTIDEVNARGAPVVLDVLDARQALVAANNAAAASFATPGDVRLTGAGTLYQSEISLASQDLEQVAALNDAGPDGIAAAQSAAGQLNAYTGLVQQADAYYASGEAALGAAAEWQASQLMDSSGVLASLTALQADEQAAVDARSSGFWASPLVIAVWAGPAILLLGGLLAAQAFLARRFRRRVSIPLASATVLVLALTAGSVTIALADYHLSRGHADLARLTAERAASIGLLDRQGQEAVLSLVTAQCTGQPSGCGPTVAAARKKLTQAGPAGGVQSGHLRSRIAADTSAAVTQLGAADDGYGMQFAIPAAAVAAAGLMMAGLQSRIDEYR